MSPTPHIFSYFLYYPFLRSGQFKRKVLGIEGIEYLPYLIKIQAAIFTLSVFAITQNVELHIKTVLQTSGDIVPYEVIQGSEENEYYGWRHPTTSSDVLL